MTGCARRGSRNPGPGGAGRLGRGGREQLRSQGLDGRRIQLGEGVGHDRLVLGGDGGMRPGPAQGRGRPVIGLGDLGPVAGTAAPKGWL
jgi:hypothetical protein